MSEPRKLPERLVEPDAFSLERGFQALVRRRDARRRNEQRAHRAIAVLAIAACVVLVALQLRPSHPDVIASSSEPTTFVASDRVQTRSFEDGSVLTLAPHARLTTLGSSVRRVSARVDRGQVTFDLEPLPEKRWDIDANIAQLQASDARFVVDRSEHALRVQVLRGAVLVYAAQLPGGRVRVTEGQTVRVPQVLAAAPVRKPDPPKQVESQEPTRAPPEKAPVTRMSTPTLPGPAVMEQPSADTLLNEADAARQGGRASDASGALKRFIEHYPSDRRVGMAAFTLGKLSLESLNEPESAARWFRLALARGVPAMLAEDAAARLVEALASSGDPVAAREARERYQAQYPTGRYMRQVQAWAP